MLKEEFNQIAFSLEKYHSIFSTLFRIGIPEYTEDIDTAGVSFDKEGQYIKFMINKNFWDQCSYKKKLFLICHECLHVFLNHGERCINNRKYFKINNMAMDISINHMLIKYFNFKKEDLGDWEKYCWIETVFKDIKKETILENQNYEYYFNLLKKYSKKINVKLTLDYHDGLSSFDSESIKEINSTISDSLSKEEKEDFAKKTEQDGGIGHVGEPLIPGKNIEDLSHINSKTVKKKKKWQDVLDHFVHKKEKEQEYTQWARLNRRFALLDSDFILPSEMETDHQEKDKYDLFMFLDTSGSCRSMREQFLKAAMSIDRNVFNIRLFSRTTNVKEIDINNPVIHFGGSDDFSCIEKFIQQELKSGKIKRYPSVFHITDGGDCSPDIVNPQHPEMWYWFLSYYGHYDRIPLKCKKLNHVYNLSDFE